eukprot:604601-Rhodomonas_salina.6
MRRTIRYLIPGHRIGQYPILVPDIAEQMRRSVRYLSNGHRVVTYSIAVPDVASAQGHTPLQYRSSHSKPVAWYHSNTAQVSTGHGVDRA